MSSDKSLYLRSFTSKERRLQSLERNLRKTNESRRLDWLVWFGLLWSLVSTLVRRCDRVRTSSCPYYSPAAWSRMLANTFNSMSCCCHNGPATYPAWSSGVGISTVPQPHVTQHFALFCDTGFGFFLSAFSEVSLIFFSPGP